MQFIFIILFVILIFTSIYLFINNIRIKRIHERKMNKLKKVIRSLHEKQRLLNDKVIINTDFNASYTKDMKALGDEVVELQRVFLELISEKN